MFAHPDRGHPAAPLVEQLLGRAAEMHDQRLVLPLLPLWIGQKPLESAAGADPAPDRVCITE